MRTTTPLQYGAMAWAIALLGIQLMAGFEYTEGGSLYTKLSMIATMLTIAALPVFIEGARRTRSYGIMAALSVAFVAFLTYSLPATIGRTGEVKEVKAMEAKASGQGRILLEQELARTYERITMATNDVAAKCKNAYSDNCKAARLVESERLARADQLRNELGHTPAAKVGDVGSDSVAWLLTLAGVPADAVRRASSLAFAIGLDIIVWALIWFGTSDRIAGRKTVSARDAEEVEPLPPARQPLHEAMAPLAAPLAKMPTQSEVVQWRDAFVKRHGRLPYGSELQAEFAGIPRTTAHYWAKGETGPRVGRQIRRIVAA